MPGHKRPSWTNRGPVPCTLHIEECDRNGAGSAHAGFGSGALKIAIRFGLGVHSAAIGVHPGSGPEFSWADFWVMDLAEKQHRDVAVAHDGPGTGTVVLYVGAGWVRPREKSKIRIISFHGWCILEIRYRPLAENPRIHTSRRRRPPWRARHPNHRVLRRAWVC